jgi:hypothetical protein
MLGSGGVGDALAFVVKARTVVAAARLYPALQLPTAQTPRSFLGAEISISRERTLILGEKMLVFPPEMSIFAEEIRIPREKMYILREKMHILPPGMSIFAEEIGIPWEKTFISGERMLISPANRLISRLDILPPALFRRADRPSKPLRLG